MEWRGRELLSRFNLEALVPREHPGRVIQANVNETLAPLGGDLDMLRAAGR